MATARYIDCADTAKFVRRALREAFPGVTFSVRSKVYSGGSSISVRWTDGPLTRDVERVAKQYQGAGFDGSIDLKYYASHWLTPDGRVRVAYNEGTTGSRGVVPPEIDEPMRGAERVRFMADFISCQREISAARRSKIQEQIAAYTGRPYGDNERYCCVVVDGIAYGRYDGEYGSTLVCQIAERSGQPVHHVEEVEQ